MRAPIPPPSLAGEGRRPGAYTYPLPHPFQANTGRLRRPILRGSGRNPPGDLEDGYFGLDPQGPKKGEGRRRELSGALRTPTVAPLWETHKTMFRQNALNTKPRRWTGFLEAFAVASCKVDGDGNQGAECKRNLPDHPDERQA